MKPGTYGNDTIIKCLKTAFKHNKLTIKCEKEIAGILHDQALDINLNPLLRAVCKDELQTVCKLGEGTDIATVEECLKNALLEKKIATPACQVEVAGMIEESQADIQVDPLLQQTCALDLLKFCNDVPQGNGRRKWIFNFIHMGFDSFTLPSIYSIFWSYDAIYNSKIIVFCRKFSCLGFVSSPHMLVDVIENSCFISNQCQKTALKSFKCNMFIYYVLTILME